MVGGKASSTSDSVSFVVPPVRTKPNRQRVPDIDGSVQLPLLWRAHYVAVAFEETASIVSALRDKGFEVVVFAGDESSWPGTFSRLSVALGRS